MDVSIPNGMEFYASRGRSISYLAKFQFPTGWNSTHLKIPATFTPYVSIPNGMEFYMKPAFCLLL